MNKSKLDRNLPSPVQIKRTAASLVQTLGASDGLGIPRKRFSPGTPLSDKLARFAVMSDGCWGWTGYVDQKGYAVLVHNRTVRCAARWMYLDKKGPIPPGYVVDHICRNRLCTNPDHLRAITNKENVLIGVGVAAVNAKKTHCIRGHEFSPENTRIYCGERRCRICDRETQKRYRQRRASK